MTAIGMRMLDLDPALERAVAPGRREAARAVGRAQMLTVDAGTSLDFRACALAAGGFGLLVCDGVLLYELAIDGRCAADLLGHGDLVPASQGEAGTERCTTCCRALTPARLAVLGPRWVARMAPFPELGGELVDRAVGQSLRLAALVGLTHEPLLELRLWTLLWHLADRFGHVHPDGVHIDVPLTHDVLAVLSRARRPSVSTALGSLAAQGLLDRHGRAWVLRAEPGARPRRVARRGFARRVAPR